MCPSGREQLWLLLSSFLPSDLGCSEYQEIYFRVNEYVSTLLLSCVHLQLFTAIYKRMFNAEPKMKEVVLGVGSGPINTMTCVLKLGLF